jgi:hypothetical protein
VQDDLTRAQHYRAMALQMRESAQDESDAKRRQEQLELASQYERLADKLVGNHVSRVGV